VFVVVVSATSTSASASLIAGRRVGGDTIGWYAVIIGDGGPTVLVLFEFDFVSFPGDRTNLRLLLDGELPVSSVDVAEALLLLLVALSLVLLLE
jgi:hypothetical protein